MEMVLLCHCINWIHQEILYPNHKECLILSLRSKNNLWKYSLKNKKIEDLMMMSMNFRMYIYTIYLGNYSRSRTLSLQFISQFIHVNKHLIYSYQSWQKLFWCKITKISRKKDPVWRWARRLLVRIGHCQRRSIIKITSIPFY